MRRRWPFLVASVLCLAVSFLTLREVYNAAGFAILAPGYRPPPFKPDARVWMRVVTGVFFLVLSVLAFEKGRKRPIRFDD